jgi:hypothetical protein
MWHDLVLDREFFAVLLALDAEIAERVRAAGCSRCGGPLCVGHYERKPRGGRIAAAGAVELFSQRFSYCCGREGCRKRATPPSVRFLGRRVYLEGAILLACTLVPLLEQTAAAIEEATGIALRTIRRWQAWWQTVFVASAQFAELRGRAPGVDPEDLPGAMLGSFAGRTPIEKLLFAMKFLGPLSTTTSGASIAFVEGGAWTRRR